MKKLLIVSAFYIEAKSIIEKLNLKQSQKKPFKMYENEQITLIISGIGKINSAIATTYAFNSHESLYNFGICGAKKDIEISKMCSIKSIIDKSTDKKYQISDDGFTLTTIDKASTSESDFKTDLCDMEAFGFYQAALKFVKKENIFIYKIVSDNLNTNIDTKHYENIINDRFLQLLKDKLS